MINKTEWPTGNPSWGIPKKDIELEIQNIEYAKSRNITKISITIYLDIPTHQLSNSQNNMPKDDKHLQRVFMARA